MNVNGSYDSVLVVLSILIAVVAAYAALELAARASVHRSERNYWLAGGSVAMGIGIWSMHFIGMLAFSLPVPISYDIDITLVSVLIAVAVAALALAVASRESMSASQLLVAGAIMGAGIAAMHYTGMAAMRMQAVVDYQQTLVLLSVAIAIVASIAALWMVFKLRDEREHWIQLKMAAACVMGVGIAGMHYTGMAAAGFVHEATLQVVTGPGIGTTLLAILVAVATMMILGFSLLAALLDQHLSTQSNMHRDAFYSSQSDLSLLLETMVEGYITIDTNGMIIAFNAAAERIFGYAADEVAGKNVKMLMPEPHCSAHDGYLMHYLHTGEKKIIGTGREVMGLAKDGSAIPLELAVTEVCLGDERKFIGTVRDISERVDSRQAIEEKNRELERANTTKSEFLANMSHELRTPLNAIIGFSDLLKDGMLGEVSAEQKEPLDEIYNSGQHLLSLINEILDLSKVEAGKMELELGESSVPDTLQSSYAMVRERAMKRQIQLELDCADGIDTWQMDQRRIKQVIINLLSNAIKFTPKGGSVRMAARMVNGEALDVRCETLDEGCENHTSLLTPDSSHNENFLEISVADTGIGIKPEDQRRLFQPFVQLDDSLSRRYEGTGLGLALSRKIVELHGGRIWLESKKDHGSTFYIALPAEVGFGAGNDSGIASWSHLLRHLNFAENMEQRNNSPFAMLRICAPRAVDPLHIPEHLKRIVRSRDLIAHGDQPGEYLILMLHADAAQAAKAEQRFSHELTDESVDIQIGHAACPEHAPDAASLLAHLQAKMTP